MKYSNKLTLAALLATICLTAPSMSAELQQQGRLLVGTDQGIWRGANGGATSGITDGTSAQQAGGAPAGKLYVATDVGVYNSANGGSPAGITDGTSTMPIDPGGPNVVFIGGARVAGSDDKGAGNNTQPSSFGGFTGGVNVAVGDVNGDSRTNLQPYDPKFSGGVNVSGSDGKGGGANTNFNSVGGTTGFGGGMRLGVGDIGGDAAKPDGHMPTDQKSRFATLSGVGGMNQLFANSRGGDQGNGGAVQSGLGYATLTVGGVSRNSADGAGGGSGAGKVQMQDLNVARANAAQGAGGGAGKGQAEIIVGAGAGSTPQVKVIDGTRLPGSTAAGAGAGPHVKAFGAGGAAAAGPNVAAAGKNVVATTK